MRLSELDRAHRPYRVCVVQEKPVLLKELLAKLGSASCQLASHSVTFEVLPDSFDWIEVRDVRREIDRLDVVPEEPLGLLPGCVVKNQADASPRLFRRCGFVRPAEGDCSPMVTIRQFRIIHEGKDFALISAGSISLGLPGLGDR